MNHINFTLEWDKLKDPQFTTIRSWNTEKELYYRSCIGQEFSILLQRDCYDIFPKKIGKAILKGITVVEPDKLPTELLSKDVTLNGKIQQEWYDKLLAMPKAMLLEFENAGENNE
ncbi:MAG: hypothetical protein ACYDAO_04420 [Thermoplasmataceae archaeon]